MGGCSSLPSRAEPLLGGRSGNDTLKPGLCSQTWCAETGPLSVTSSAQPLTFPELSSSGKRDHRARVMGITANEFK